MNGKEKKEKGTEDKVKDCFIRESIRSLASCSVINQVFDDVKISNRYPWWIFNKQYSFNSRFIFCLLQVITTKNLTTTTTKKTLKKRDLIEWWLYIFDDPPPNYVPYKEFKVIANHHMFKLCICLIVTSEITNTL